MFTKVNSPVKFKVSATSTVALLFVSSLFMVPSTYSEGPSNDDSRGLNHWLTEEQIEAFGLSSLSQPQEQALSRWIGDQIAAKAQLEAAGTVQLQGDSTAKEFEATVLGEIDGWNGNAVFKLDNGQVWVQRGNERSNKQLSNPRVSIRQNFLGFYVLTFTATGQKVRVKRRQ